MVEIPSNGDVFYTIDGDKTHHGKQSLFLSLPNASWCKYIEICYHQLSGVKSDVTVCKFNLTVSGEITPAQAVNSLVMELDYNEAVGLEGRNAYLMNSAIRISGQDYYLIYREIRRY